MVHSPATSKHLRMGPTLIQHFGMSQLQFGTLTTAFAMAKPPRLDWRWGDWRCRNQQRDTEKKRAAISDYIQWIGLRENLQEPPIFHRKEHVVSCRCSLKPIQWRRSVFLLLDGCSFHDVRWFHQIGPNSIVELPWPDGEPMRPKRSTISTGRTGMVEIYIYIYLSISKISNDLIFPPFFFFNEHLIVW